MAKTIARKAAQRTKTGGSDLRHAFTKSIAKARKENKQKLGVRDYRAERV